MPSKDWYSGMAQRIERLGSGYTDYPDVSALKNILTDLLLALRQVEAEAIISRHPDRTRSAVLAFQDKKQR